MTNVLHQLKHLSSWSERVHCAVTAFRWPLLILGALLLGLTVIFPQVGLLEWVALIPAFCAILALTADKTVRYPLLYLMGLVFFLTFYLVNFHWFLYMYPLDFADMSRPASAVVVSVAWIGLSLFQAIGAAILFPLMAFAVRGRWLSRHPVLHPLLFAALWTVLEWWQAHSGWSGVPWARLALGQAEILPTMQSATLFGSYIVTFLLLTVNGLLAYMLLYANRRILCGTLAGGLFLGNLAFGLIRIATVRDEGEPIRIAAIQGNQSSLEYWGASTMTEVLTVYGELSIEAAEAGADVIVWPETCVPVNIDREAWAREYITELSVRCGVPILCGVFTNAEGSAYYNSIAVALPDGTVLDTVYSKRNPVPFGEFVPFRDVIMTLIPPLAEINTLGTDIPAGEESVVFDLEAGKIGSLICFDSIYERNAFDSVQNGARLLAVSTNDSWFKDSRGVWMHCAQSQLRAIETGRYIARSANTGVSAIISPTGEKLKVLDALKTGYVMEEVYLSDRTTVYSVIGDTFAYLCVVVCGAAVLLPLGERLVRREFGKWDKTVA